MKPPFHLPDVPWELRVPFGVDLGTNHLTAAILDATDEHLLLARDNHGRVRFPARVALAPDQPATPLWQLLDQSEPIHLGQETLSRTQLVARFLLNLREGLKQVLPNQNYCLDQATVAIPTNCPSQQQDTLRAAGRLAGLELTLLPQPLAVAAYYAWLHGWTEGTWLVCDVGVHWQAALVWHQEEQLELIDSLVSTRGGQHFDDVLAEHLLARSQESTCAEPQRLRWRRVAAAVRTRLRERDAVQRLVPDFWPAGSGPARPLEVTLTRAELENILADSIREGVQECRELIQKTQAAGKVNLPLNGVLLAGGSAWVPGLVSQLQEQLGDLLRSTEPISHEPEWCLVRGAALHAAQQGKTYLFGGKSDPGEHQLHLRSPLTTMTNHLVLAGQARSSTLADLHQGGSVRLLDLSSGWAEEIYFDPQGRFSHTLDLEVGSRSLLLILAGAAGDAVAALPLEVRRPKQLRWQQLQQPTLPETLYLELVDSQLRRQRHPLARAGAHLPGTFTCSARTTDRSGKLVLPLFQEGRLLRSFVITGVDPGLCVGSIIDIRLRVDVRHQMELEVKVQATGWRERESCPLLQPPTLPTPAEIEQLRSECEHLLPTGQDSPSRVFYEQALGDLHRALAECEDELAIQHWLTLLDLRQQLQQLSGQPLHPPWPRFAQLIKHCLFLAGDVAHRTGREREELFEQVYAQERIAEQAYQTHNSVQYRECVANLLHYARYLEQLHQDQLHDPRQRTSDQQQRLERELLADPGTAGMLEGPI